MEGGRVWKEGSVDGWRHMLVGDVVFLVGNHHASCGAYLGANTLCCHLIRIGLNDPPPH